MHLKIIEQCLHIKLICITDLNYIVLQEDKEKEYTIVHSRNHSPNALLQKIPYLTMI